MDSRSISSQNRTAGCENPGVFSGSGGRTPPKPSGDRNQSLNAAGSSSGGQRGTTSFPPAFSGDEPRPLQTNFFRYASLFFAHLGPEEESEQWASFLPENLRPGNIEKYLEETDTPQLYGNNYWWLSQENSAHEQPSFHHNSDPIQYSRAQLLELREKVTAIPENIQKINQEIEAECLAMSQITECGGTKGANISLNSLKETPQTREKENEVENISVNSMNEVPQTAEKEKLEVASVHANSMQGEPQTGEKERQEGSVSESKKEKKKHRVLSKERKEKRKIAKKKKQAEKNRKLGVKRLKIQPLLKPKPVSHCRHYLKGRCHEGEKCKFSHDVQPLTKSLPCCHFARQSCMKGDDCPYDHDLSKYPCNKYVSTGFCSRKENCLFSHKVTPNQDPAPSPPTTSTTRAETKASDSIQRHSQKSQFIFGAYNQQAEISLNVSAAKADLPMKAPQGLSFLHNGNSQKDKQRVPTSTSAHVIVSGKNNNKTAFGGDPKGATLPSDPPASPHSTGVFVFGKNPPHDNNLPASPNSAGVFVFGKNPPPDHNVPASPNSAGVFVSGRNPPPDHNLLASPNPAGVFVFGKNPPPNHNPPASPNPAGVFVFGKNPPPDHNKRNQPSLLPFGNNNKTQFGGGKKDSGAPSGLPTSAFSARLSGLMKNTSSSCGQPSSLSTSASGSSHVNGSWANKNQGTGPVSGSEPFESRVNVNASAGTNSASADASKKPLSAVEVMWELLYGKGRRN